MQNLRNNFEGQEGEKIRQILLNHAPKYGNDDDYVDSLLVEAYNILSRNSIIIIPPVTVADQKAAGIMRALPVFQQMFRQDLSYRPLLMEERHIHLSLKDVRQHRVPIHWVNGRI